jgi:Sushi repeat (SCR repeat)
VDCGSVKAPEHGSVKLVNSRTTHGAIAEVTCESNYTMKGEPKRKCGDDGKWSGEEPQCLCKKLNFKAFEFLTIMEM